MTLQRKNKSTTWPREDVADALLAQDDIALLGKDDPCLPRKGKQP